MPRKRLFLVMLFANVVVFGNGRTIQDQSLKRDITNGTQDHLADNSFESKIIRAERLRSKEKIDNICVGNCSGKGLHSSSNNRQLYKSCPFQHKQLCLIFSLSKLAKIQVANLSEVPPADRIPNQTIFNDNLEDVKGSRIIEQLKKIGDTRFDYGEETKIDKFQKFTKKHRKPANVHCRAIRDVYIPDVKRNLPAFACKFGNNTFILSSTRFLEDRRLYLDITVDEGTFKNIKSVPKIARSNEVKAIPALLILNALNNNYEIEVNTNIVNERNLNRTRKSR